MFPRPPAAPYHCPKGCRWNNEFLSKYQVGKILGEGAFGCVHEGVDNSTNEKVAIKKIKNFSSNYIDAQRLLREISILRMMKGHPNLISLKYIATSASKDKFNEIDLVFERYATDLFEVINSRQVLTVEHIQYFLYQILCGVYSLHSAKLVHRDLKPSNILLNANCKAVICDFGLSRATHYREKASISTCSTPPPLFRKLTPYVVTRWYRSPELIIDGRSEAPADMWSAGCILAELIIRKPLFPGDSSEGVLDLIFNLIGTPDKGELGCINDKDSLDYVASFSHKPPQDFKQKFPRADASVIDLLKKLLVFNPAKRMTAEQALRHPFFSNLLHREDLLTFPLQSRTVEDERSFRDYYQFEEELDGQTSKSEAEIAQGACDLVLNEIARYAPKPTSIPVTALSSSSSSSLNTPCSFFNQEEPSVKASSALSSVPR
jgi:serine/threonine protein kinase